MNEYYTLFWFFHCGREASKRMSLFSLPFPNLVKLNDLAVKLLARLRLEFSHLNEHKFKHGFGGTVSPMCGCNAEIENTERLLLRCHFYSAQRFEVFNNINKIDLSFTQLGTKKQVNILLYGYPLNKSYTLNRHITAFVINFHIKSGRLVKTLISFNQ